METKQEFIMLLIALADGSLGIAQVCDSTGLLWSDVCQAFPGDNPLQASVVIAM